MTNFLSRDVGCTPLTVGLGASPPVISVSPSSLTSRFRLVEELIDIGEPGRDKSAGWGTDALPLRWGCVATATAGEAIFGGGSRVFTGDTAM